jgi:LPS O-antigen subunit length determinant protein (WzzB/FepE family)
MKLKKIFQGKLLEEIIKIIIISVLYLAFGNVLFSKQNWWSSMIISRPRGLLRNG